MSGGKRDGHGCGEPALRRGTSTAVAALALAAAALLGPVPSAAGTHLDVVNGGQDGERLVGTSRSDRLYGHGGRDRLFGHRSDDVLSGGRGADRLRPGPGADTVKCGAGADLVIDAHRIDGIDSSCEQVHYQHERGGLSG